MTNEVNEKVRLVQYLLQKVKEKDLDPKEAAKYVKLLNSMPEEKKAEKAKYYAIIGISCNYPDAEDKYEFWKNIKNKVDSMNVLSEFRRENFGLDGTEQMSQKDRGGYLKCIDHFDYEYFNIPPKTAKEMDPYHRLMLQTFVETIEDAGYKDTDLSKKKIGVFVGNDHTHRMITSYLSYMDKIDIGKLTGSWSAILASRISYLLNLTGPAMVIDTACSSALVAIDIAIKSMQSGDCEAALIGGVNLFLSKSEFDMQVNSVDYAVRTFDERAGGTVFSEGIAGVMIKPYEDAVKDHDNIQGIIRGVAVNNDGRSNGITAPSAKAQKEVLLNAWKKAEISPETISYIEAHGTGTGLGDPIEIQGLTGAFRKYTNRKQFCGIGSIKTNIGHTVGAAGLASLIKVVMALQNKQLPPSIHFDVPNSFIDFCGGPVYVQDALADWPAGAEPRRAGVSSFSFAGTNAHMVLEEAPADDRQKMQENWEIFTVSGRDLQLLKESTARHIRHFNDYPEQCLQDVCYTAGAGRHHYEYRAAVIGKNLRGIKQGLYALEAFLEAVSKGEKTEDQLFVDCENYKLIFQNCIPEEGINEETTRYIEKLRSDWDVKACLKLAQDYVGGAVVDFQALYEQRNVKRCSLPAEPFKRFRLWEDSGEQNASVSKVKVKENLLEKYERTCNEKKAIRLEEETSDDLELKIAWLWSEVLGYPKISRDDDFYSLGGDSINGYEVINYLSEMLHLDLAVSELLANSKFSDFVQEIRYDLEETCISAESPVERSDEGKYEDEKNGESVLLPLLPPQSRLYRTVMLNPESTAYNITQTLRLNQSETYQKVNEIMQILCRRHEAFRTSFLLQDETPMQKINPDAEFCLEHKRVNSSEETEEDVLKRETDSFRKPFDITRAPLIRMLYLEFEKGNTYLILDMHHIIIDGTSIGILLNEFKMLSEGGKLGSMQFNYRDAVSSFHKDISDERLNKQREWWLQQYSESVPVLDLPIDMARKMTHSFSGSRVFEVIPPEDFNELTEITKQSGVTMFVALLGILHLLLARISNNRDFGIGVAVTGHTNHQMQDVIGMFVNSLPLRIASDEEETFGEFITRLRDYVYQAYNNQQYQYEDLIKELNVDRTNGHNPLFDVFFSYQNINIGIDDSEEENISFYSEGAKFDLTVSAMLGSKGLKLEWEYADSLFYASTIERIAHQYAVMVKSIISNPNQKISDLRIVDQSEERQLKEWSSIPVKELDDRGILHYFSENVSQYGEHDALILGDRHMTYAELNRKSNQVAHRIHEMGIPKGHAVAIMLERSFEMIISIIGVLKAGCYYLPIDTEAPRNRFMDMVEDTGAKVLISKRGVLKEKLDGLDILWFDEINENDRADDLEIETNGDSNIYVMYTSGSTGKPKGIQIRMKNVIRVVKNNGYLELNEKDRILQLSNYSFDGSVFDIFGALLNGATLVLVSKEQMSDLTKVGGIIKDNKVTVFFVTTALFNALVDTALDELETTRAILFGGEVASVAHVNKAFERLGPGRVCNVYGPTESTVFTTFYYINEKVDSLSVPLGRPIGNTKVFVLDEKRRLLPIGAEGELYIGGLGLAKGYLNNPELTADRFIESPIEGIDRLYKSGDIVKWEPDGQLRYMSRKDNQVKLRGFRIELNEVQNIAQNYPGVQDAFAGVYESNHVKHLCLWIIRNRKESYDEQELRSFMAEYLPEYMIPTFIVEMEQFPLNKNKKVDKARLTAPVTEMPCSDKDGRPRNSCEKMLVEIWSKVLGNEQIGIYDNFFTVGGDSIKAILLISKMKAAGYMIGMDKLFEYPHIADLAKFLQLNKAKQIPQEDISGKCMPSMMQYQFMNKMGEMNKFNHAMRFRVQKKYDGAEFEKILLRLCRHHDMLRMTAQSAEEIAVRGSDADRLFFLQEVSEQLWNSDFPKVLDDLQNEISIKNGPLLAVGVKQNDDSFDMVIVIHHLAVDVISWNIILEDLAALIFEPEMELPDKTDSFQRWAQELWNWGKNGEILEELDYWEKIALRASKTRGIAEACPVKYQDTVKRRIWIKDFEEILSGKNSAQDTSGNRMELVLAILVRSICQLFDVPELLVNLEGHGRENFCTDLDVSRTVGWFTSTYPVLLQTDDKMGKTIEGVKENLRNVPRKGFGFGILKNISELSKEDKELLNGIAPQVSFNYLGMDNEQTGGGIDLFERLPGEMLIDGNYRSDFMIDVVAYQSKKDVCIEMDWYEGLLSTIDFTAFEELVQANAKEAAVTDCDVQQVAAEEENSRFDYSSDELADIFEELGIE